MIKNQGDLSNVSLSSLTVKADSTVLTLVPFATSSDSGYTVTVTGNDYRIKVPYSTTEIILNGKTGDGSARLSPGGEIKRTLAFGDNVIPLTVTSADWSKTRTYTVTVNRSSLPSDNADLLGITIRDNYDRLRSLNDYLKDNDPNTTEKFSPDRHDAEADSDYAITVPNTIEEISFEVRRASPGASVSIVKGSNTYKGNGDKVPFVPLEVGENLFPITVTAENGYIQTYTIKITRKDSAAPAANLYILMVDGNYITITGSDLDLGLISVPYGKGLVSSGPNVIPILAVAETAGTTVTIRSTDTVTGGTFLGTEGSTSKGIVQFVDGSSEIILKIEVRTDTDTREYTVSIKYSQILVSMKGDSGTPQNKPVVVAAGQIIPPGKYGFSNLTDTTIWYTPVIVDGRPVKNFRYDGNENTIYHPYVKPDGFIHTDIEFISNRSQLESLRAKLGPNNKLYIITDDIDLDDDDPATDNEWAAPIGSGDGNSAFQGELDGTGHKIDHLVFPYSTTDKRFYGLFGYLQDAKITDLNIAVEKPSGGVNNIRNSGISSHSDSSIGKNLYIGVLAGYSLRSKVTKVHVSGAIEIAGDAASMSNYIGGLVGYLDSGSEIDHCILGGSALPGFDLKISASAGTVNMSAGGLVGTAAGYPVIKKSSYTGSMEALHKAGSSATSKSLDAGGILGGNGSSTVIITDCDYKGTVTAKTNSNLHSGGIAGSFAAGSEIQNSEVINGSDITAEFTGTLGSNLETAVGGIVGVMNGTSRVENARVTNTTVTGMNAGSPGNWTYVGGIAGHMSGSVTSGTTASGTTVSGSTASGNITGINGFLYVGGVAGQVRGSTIYQGAFNPGNDPFVVKAEFNTTHQYRLGGVAGHIDDGGEVRESFAQGTVRAATQVNGGTEIHHTGGIVGRSIIGNANIKRTTVENCFFYGNIEVGSSNNDKRVGGILGGQEVSASARNSTNTVQYCYSRGTIEAPVKSSAATPVRAHVGLGGIVGHQYSGYDNNNKTILQNCVALVTSITNTAAGGNPIGKVYGEVESPSDRHSFTSNYSRSPMTGVPSFYGDLGTDYTDTGKGSKNGEGISSWPQSFFITATNWTGSAWDFDTVWKMDDDGYPVLRWANP
jgi:hypothetical protein